ncbi:hypothetical protein VitviT2T_022920 [Vitis vinifera]|uniref:Uncharacterized protein n=1 Tax=Vitis vinifera TaxID=29760 RepID=A0ABY9DCM0_VITVI|nr:hypothetical protein VitviT2T_022920 [Vitis vinifera]
MDDPLVIASLLPPSALLIARSLRWTMCAIDQCFKNPMTSTIFRWVKVLPVSHGDEIYKKAWNLKTEMQYSIDGPVGQVYALEATTEDVLFAGTEDGSIFIWKCNPESNSFPLISILKGHTASVLSLQVGCKSLYSSSMDNMIRIWACGKDGSMGVTHTRDEEHPILALFGMDDAYDKPILCCSCNDNSAILYELPSFTKRGTIFGKQEVGRIQSGPGGLFFTGDGTGLLHALF